MPTSRPSIAELRAATQPPQIFERIRQPIDNALELRANVGAVGRKICLGGAYRQPKRYEPLLRSVVKVSLDAAASLVGRGDDPPAGRSELGLAFGIGDRSCYELGELHQAFLCVQRQRLVGGCETHGTPEAALDDNRGSHGRNDAQVASDGKDVRAVDAGSAARAIDLGRSHSLLELQACPDRDVVRIRVTDEDDSRRLGLEPEDRRTRAEETLDLVAHSREDVGGRNIPRPCRNCSWSRVTASTFGPSVAHSASVAPMSAFTRS